MSHIKVLAALVIQLATKAHAGRQWGMDSSAGSLLPSLRLGKNSRCLTLGWLLLVFEELNQG